MRVSTNLIKPCFKPGTKEKCGNKKTFSHKSPSKLSLRHRILSVLRRTDTTGSVALISITRCFLSTFVFTFVSLARLARQCDNYNLKSHKYVMCITSNQPDTKYNPNPISTTLQHAIVNIQPNIVTYPIYVSREINTRHCCCTVCNTCNCHIGRLARYRPDMLN